MPFWSSCFLFWPPCPLGWALFAPVGPICGSSFPAVPICLCLCCSLGSVVATGASVHRRGRCIGVSLPLVNDTALAFCACVSVRRRDSALVLLNSFCFDCLLLLHAPPPLLSSCHLALLWSCAVCLSSAVSVLFLVSLCLSFVCLCACCPVGLCLRAFFGSAGSLSFCWFVLLSCAGAGLGVSRVACSPLLCFLPLFFSSSPAPRVVSFVLWSSSHSCVLVPPSEYLVAAVTALLPCFHAGSVVLLCFPSVIRFMATKASCPVWGFLPSTPCYW